MADLRRADDTRVPAEWNRQTQTPAAPITPASAGVFNHPLESLQRLAGVSAAPVEVDTTPPPPQSAGTRAALALRAGVSNTGQAIRATVGRGIDTTGRVVGSAVTNAADFANTLVGASTPNAAERENAGTQSVDNYVANNPVAAARTSSPDPATPAAAPVMAGGYNLSAYPGAVAALGTQPAVAPAPKPVAPVAASAPLPGEPGSSTTSGFGLNSKPPTIPTTQTQGSASTTGSSFPQGPNPFTTPKPLTLGGTASTTPVPTIPTGDDLKKLKLAVN